MANSNRKRVLNYIRDTVFDLITTGNGYNTTPVTKERGILPVDTMPESSFPALFLGTSTEERENITHNQFLGRIQTAMIGYVRNSSGTTGLQENLDDLIEDLTKALGQDRTLGGNVKWIVIKSVSTDDGDLEPFAAFLMVVELAYAQEDITP